MLQVILIIYRYALSKTLTGCSSTFRYLLNPKMEFVKFYGKNYDTDSLADGIIKEIKEHK